MKMVYCPYCKFMFNLADDGIRECRCGKAVGKYLDDGMTCVATRDSWVFAIDTDTFGIAVQRAMEMRKHGISYAGFFTGWLHSIPDSNVILVKDRRAVEQRKRRRKGTGTHGNFYKKRKSIILERWI